MNDFEHKTNTQLSTAQSYLQASRELLDREDPILALAYMLETMSLLERIEETIGERKRP